LAKEPTRQQLSSLVALARLRAGASFSYLPSGKLAEELGLSQQAASKRLSDLEEAGLIERAHTGRGLSVRLTDPGLRAVHALYSDLKTALDTGDQALQFRGKVFTGFQEGGYYISLKGYARQFREALGFEPFPGTLNLRLTDPTMVSQRRRLHSIPGVEVKGFRDGRRSYGPVKCFRARIGGRCDGAILAIERTHYDTSVLEVIAPTNLRRALGVEDGDDCEVTAYLG